MGEGKQEKGERIQEEACLPSCPLARRRREPRCRRGERVIDFKEF